MNSIATDQYTVTASQVGDTRNLNVKWELTDSFQTFLSELVINTTALSKRHDASVEQNRVRPYMAIILTNKATQSFYLQIAPVAEGRLFMVVPYDSDFNLHAFPVLCRLGRGYSRFESNTDKAKSYIESMIYRTIATSYTPFDQHGDAPYLSAYRNISGDDKWVVRADGIPRVIVPARRVYPTAPEWSNSLKTVEQVVAWLVEHNPYYSGDLADVFRAGGRFDNYETGFAIRTRLIEHLQRYIETSHTEFIDNCFDELIRASLFGEAQESFPSAELVKRTWPRGVPCDMDEYPVDSIVDDYRLHVSTVLINPTINGTPIITAPYGLCRNPLLNGEAHTQIRELVARCQNRSTRLAYEDHSLWLEPNVSESSMKSQIEVDASGELSLSTRQRVYAAPVVAGVLSSAFPDMHDWMHDSVLDGKCASMGFDADQIKVLDAIFEYLADRTATISYRVRDLKTVGLAETIHQLDISIKNNFGYNNIPYAMYETLRGALGGDVLSDEFMLGLCHKMLDVITHTGVDDTPVDMIHPCCGALVRVAFDAITDIAMTTFADDQTMMMGLCPVSLSDPYTDYNTDKSGRSPYVMNRHNMVTTQRRPTNVEPMGIAVMSPEIVAMYTGQRPLNPSVNPVSIFVRNHGQSETPSKLMFFIERYGRVRSRSDDVTIDTCSLRGRTMFLPISLVIHAVSIIGALMAALGILLTKGFLGSLQILALIPFKLRIASYTKLRESDDYLAAVWKRIRGYEVTSSDRLTGEEGLISRLILGMVHDESWVPFRTSGVDARFGDWSTKASVLLWIAVVMVGLLGFGVELPTNWFDVALWALAGTATACALAFVMVKITMMVLEWMRGRSDDPTYYQYETMSQTRPGIVLFYERTKAKVCKKINM